MFSDFLKKGLVIISWAFKGVDWTADKLTNVFIIAAILGFYISMTGFKKKGNQITSLSIFIYLIIKVVRQSV